MKTHDNIINSGFPDKIKKEIFTNKTFPEFEDSAICVFRFQYSSNLVYRQYVDLLGIKPDEIHSIRQIPFMPVEFFKEKIILSGNRTYETVFYSSGTSGLVSGKHYVADIELYKKSFKSSFLHFYGQPSDYSILALLPGYLEREGSSLVFMVNELMKLSGHPYNGFFLRDFEQLAKRIESLNNQEQKFILIGVTYGLLDFAHEFPIDGGKGIIMETGGMKGTRKELVKEEIHHILKKSFGVDTIHSEYGMTELLSQAYSKGKGIFTPPPWMKILIRDVHDPFQFLPDGVSGGINIIDLANIYSCAFIETQDLGKTYPNGQFEILGRFDNSDIRGCNLMVS